MESPPSIEVSALTTVEHNFDIIKDGINPLESDSRSNLQSAAPLSILIPPQSLAPSKLSPQPPLFPATLTPPLTATFSLSAYTSNSQSISPVSCSPLKPSPPTIAADAESFKDLTLQLDQSHFIRIANGRISLNEGGELSNDSGINSGKLSASDSPMQDKIR